MKQKNKVSLLTLILTFSIIVLISGVITLTTNIKKRKDLSNLNLILLQISFMPVDFTLKIYSDASNGYRGKCSFDGTTWEWTSWGNKTYQGTATSCWYYFTLYGPGYLTIEIYTEGKKTSSKTVSSSTTADRFIKYEEWNPAFKNLIMLLLFGPNLQPSIYAGIFMIALPIISIALSVVSYFSSEILSFKTKYPYYRRYTVTGDKNYISRFRKKSGKKIIITNCPACKAPLRKSPPCECEYCGSMLFNNKN